MDKFVTTGTGDALMLGLLSKNGEDGRLLAREPVTYSDLLPARDETWWQGLRAGVLGPDLSRIEMQILPGANKTADRLAGYSLELRDGPRSYRRQFSIGSLAAVARRSIARIAPKSEETETETESETEYSFFLTTARHDLEAEASGTEARDAKPERAAPATNGMRVTRKVELPVFESARLADYLQQSEPITGCTADLSENGDKPMPIFVLDEVWKEGHELARRGGEDESAAVWTGRLMRDVDSPEAFMVLDACLEAEYASEEKLAVHFTGETWARLREVLHMRRQRLNRPQERLLGSVHGHNFNPPANANGRTMCDLCAVAKVCSRTTAVISLVDQEWHRSVFAGQPWAIALIWGYTARPGEEDWRLYGLANGSLAPRPIHRLKS